MFSLWDILGNECEPINIIDVGAMIIDSDECAYHALLKPGVSKVIGFEPDEKVGIVRRKICFLTV